MEITESNLNPFLTVLFVIYICCSFAQNFRNLLNEVVMAQKSQGSLQKKKLIAL